MSPTRNVELLLQVNSVLVTNARLLLVPALNPTTVRFPGRSANSFPPFRVIGRLADPLLPISNWLPASQRAVELMSRTSLDLAVRFCPSTPCAELVSRVLSAI